ncbi:SIS domain-containing protein, partial [bacterium]|nr:SIS domain-containing protein [bacterium]
RNIAHVDCSVEFASEFKAFEIESVDCNTLYILISQSGKSADTVQAFKKLKALGARVLALTNNTESYMYQNANYKYLMQAFREYAICATKTFTSSVFILWLMACSLAQKKCLNISSELKDIDLIRESIEQTINKVQNIDKVSKIITKSEGLSVLGFGKYYPLARECALKIKETSYINAFSCPMGEFIHGHFAVLNKVNTVLVFLDENCTMYEIELINKIRKTYNVEMVAISDTNELNDIVTIKVPKTLSKIATILDFAVVLQLLALRCALDLGHNVDSPKGLEKIVENKENK